MALRSGSPSCPWERSSIDTNPHVFLRARVCFYCSAHRHQKDHTLGMYPSATLALLPLHLLWNIYFVASKLLLFLFCFLYFCDSGKFQWYYFSFVLDYYQHFRRFVVSHCLLSYCDTTKRSTLTDKRFCLFEISCHACPLSAFGIHLFHLVLL